jgi:hypothetical protein
VDGVAEPATQRQPPPHQDRVVALAASAWAEASVVSQPFTPGAGECLADGALGIGSLVLRTALVGAERSQGLDGPGGCARHDRPPFGCECLGNTQLTTTVYGAARFNRGNSPPTYAF